MRAIVIGAGVVGLAVARSLAIDGLEVIVLESGTTIGTGTSSRNSEVIHAGLYYRQGSAKARHCVTGSRLLYEYCASHGVAHRRCGKLIVATTAAEIAKIEALAAQGARNGVAGLQLLDATEARALEPDVNCLAALLSADTGIIDSHGLMLALHGDLEDHGGAIALATPFERAERRGAMWQVAYGGAEAGEMEADVLVNAAGLGAWMIAAAIDGFPAHHIPPRYLAKGNYFSVTRSVPFQRLIYPAPVDGGLGVHLTLDLAGRARLGPDVEWLDGTQPSAIDYTVDPRRSAAFYAAARRYWPGLPDGALAPGTSGVRPKISGPGEPAGDFMIAGPAEHGLPGLLQFFGIESPGLTSCLSLAEAARSVVGRRETSA